MKFLIPKKENLIPLDYEYIDRTIDQYYSPVYGYFMRKRLALVYSLLGKRKVGSILDIGYGGGTFIPMLSKIGKNVYGIDTMPYPEKVNRILKRENLKANLVVGSVLDLPFKKNFFDRIVCVSVLEHFKGKQLNNAIKAMFKVLKPGGSLVLGFPAKNPISNFIIDHILNFKSDEIHPSGHKQILEAIKEEVKIDKIIHYFSFMPLDFSLYCVVRVKKSK